jgi:flagellar motor switch protein FliN
VTSSTTSQESLNAAAEAAALLLAEQLGLGDQSRSTDEWPIDSSEPVLRITFSGATEGAIALAVNDDVVERLQSNADLLQRSFAGAVAAAGAVLGEGLTAGTVEQALIPVPAAGAMIMDSGALTAVVAIVLGADAPHDAGAHATTPQPVQVAAAPYEPALFDSGGHGSKGAQHGSLSVLHDVELLVTAELGRTVMPVRDVLALAPGMVVEIDRIAGSPIDLLVNGRRIAAGEVVVIDEEFGIRITEIIPAGDQR